MNTSKLPRILCQFSCGAASAVATKITLEEHKERDVVILNAFLKEEHPDNRRFLLDCEKWFGKEIIVLKNEKYEGSIIKLFKERKFMNSPYGALCSRVLKRELLNTYKKEDDILVFGYTLEEVSRYEDFIERNPFLNVRVPLIENRLSKEDCKAIIKKVGIELPFMYKLGYEHTNCIGCVQGGMQYFRAIKEDFPEEFKILADLEEEIGATLFRNSKTGVRFGLKQLPEGKVARNEELPSCSFFCEMAEETYKF